MAYGEPFQTWITVKMLAPAKGYLIGSSESGDVLVPWRLLRLAGIEGIMRSRLWCSVIRTRRGLRAESVLAAETNDQPKEIERREAENPSHEGTKHAA